MIDEWMLSSHYTVKLGTQVWHRRIIKAVSELTPKWLSDLPRGLNEKLNIIIGFIFDIRSHYNMTTQVSKRICKNSFIPDIMHKSF